MYSLGEDRRKGGVWGGGLSSPVWEDCLFSPQPTMGLGAPRAGRCEGRSKRLCAFLASKRLFWALKWPASSQYFEVSIPPLWGTKSLVFSPAQD